MKETNPDLQTIRPELSKSETRLLVQGLDLLSAAAKTMEQMDPIRDLRARLAEAAMRKRWHDILD